MHGAPSDETVSDSGCPPERAVGEPDDRPRPVGGRRTFGGRQGRMGPARQRAAEVLVPRFAVEPPFVADRLIVEIGCGKGDATAAMAPADAPALVIACEPNVAMIANLAILLDREQITNVGLWVGDALDVLVSLPPESVDEVRIWFPDPWPRGRHARKRLMTPERVGVIVDALGIGGRIRFASDHGAYTEQALATLSADPRLRTVVVDRPPERPITVFEARGLAEGRTATDLVATRIA